MDKPHPSSRIKHQYIYGDRAYIHRERAAIRSHDTRLRIQENTGYNKYTQNTNQHRIQNTVSLDVRRQTHTKTQRENGKARERKGKVPFG